MHRHPDYTRGRLARLGERLRARIWVEARPIEELEVSPPVGRVGWEEAQRLRYRPVQRDERFGPPFATFWFRGRARVPEAWRGARADLLWGSGSEAALWLDGRIVQGLNPHHGDAVLVREVTGGGAVEFWIAMVSSGLLGAADSPFVLERCDLARFDPAAWKLFHDFELLRALEAEPDLEPSWRGELLAELNRFANTPDPAILAPLLGRKNAEGGHHVSAVGHAHIDSAWLWPFAETVRKVERTLATQLGYLDEYPDYRFACSQAQQYAWIEEQSPELWARVREKVAAGRLIPVGGSWVEPDCNLPSGESLARQLLYGQRFFQRAFGVTCGEFWQPDVFGYTGQLPQLMRLAGMTRFLTQKLSWNRFTRPEHHTFTWQGIDGSEVLAHFPPADTYNGVADVAELRRAARDYKDHDRSRESYYLFGHGDGGGGPTRAMLETLGRAGDLQGLPKTRIRTPDEFFARLEADCTDRPVVVGELYLEYHRGTYTSQAWIKRANRESELALHDAELLGALAHRLHDRPYPAASLERLWKLALLDQFHDVLPGSSIAEVYQEARGHQEQIQAGAGRLVVEMAAALAGPGDELVPVNTLGVARAELHEHEGHAVWVEAPPCGLGRTSAPRGEVRIERLGDAVLLDNGILRATLGAGGTLTSLSLGGREALAGPGNVLELYEDRPNDFDAWDIDPFHLETRAECPPAGSCAVVEEGPRASVVFERQVGERSWLRQTARLAVGGAWLELATEVDWHESHRLLKVAFPAAVRATHATYEMPFGVAQRPTHYNTRHDLARYEVPGHRFADLSEHGFGVALLTDCKYGYSTHGGTLRASLLRAPTSPDPDCDRGRHTFRYAILPHAGSWQDAGVLAAAHRFATPLVWTRGRGGAPRCFASVDDPNLVLAGLKKAEDDGDLVVRLYEAHAGRGTARLRLGFPVSRASFCDLLERELEPARIEEGAVVLPYRPCQILSVKIAG